ncbi:MAG: hypothetical protein HOQ03_05655 [Thermoleophilia bacterium]|nr:hypothetical protein [Thermoleophilia bacterium]
MRIAAALCLAACSIAAGCGGSSSAQGEPEGSTLEALWRAPGEDVAVVPGSADFGPGDVRFAFLVIDGQGRVVTRPTAKIWLAKGLKEKPFAETTAKSEAIGVGKAEPGEPTDVFVAHLPLEQAGSYWLLAEPVGGRKIQAVGTVVVKEKTAAPGVGAKAIASNTPTLANATLDELTTSKVPDRELYRESVAQALQAKEPFVLTFATPKYCTSRTCGPVVDVVSAVRKRHEADGIRFIHVEIYEDNDPTKGENRWVKEWKLPSEPWVFLVGADGTIKARFEGTVSVDELDAAVAKLR